MDVRRRRGGGRATPPRRSRGGGGPHFLELRTYRFRAHSMYDPDRYRDKAEIERWKERDPIPTLADEAHRRPAALAARTRSSSMRAEVAAEVDDAVAFADAGTLEAVGDLERFVTSEAPRRRGDAVSTVTYREAMREAIREAMPRDDRVFLMGEDVGRYGGCYAVSLGLLEEFGPERIRDTPLSESAFVGAGIGAALGGMRPIVEIMTVNFSLLALDQIVNNAATLLYMSGGQFNVPLVIRMTTGAGRQLAAQHSHSLEGWYAHIPGLRILAPATVEDARGMLWPALCDPDPVLIFEHGAALQHRGRAGRRAPGRSTSPSAAVRRPGDDVTIVAYGGTLRTALGRRRGARRRGRGSRGDRPALPAAARHRRRSSRRWPAPIAPWSWTRGGAAGSLSAEVSARITEEVFYDLDAPVARVCSAEVPMPYAKHLEDEAIPQVADVVAAVRRLGA